MRDTTRRLLLTLVLLAAMLDCNGVYADERTVYSINLPAQSVAESLTSLSETLDVLLLFPYKVASELRANPVKGRYTLQQALDIMLEGTGFSGGLSEKGVLMISLEESKDASHNRETEGKKTMDSKKSLFAVVAGLLFAQGASAAPEGVVKQGRQIEEIIVTATKRSSSLQDTAMSISVLGGDTIQKRNLIGMGDYLSTLPGISVLDQGPGFNSVIMRGLSAQPQFEGFENGSPVSGVYFGETPISGLGIAGNSADIKLVDIERIEVLRGPQGTLWGAGSMGGVVRNIPASPDLKEVEGSFQVGYSNTAENGDDNSSVNGVINTPVIENELAIRAVAYWFDNSGIYKNVAASDPETSAAAVAHSAVAVDQDDIGSDEVLGGRVSALWQPTDKLAINLSYLSQDIEQDGWGQADIDLAGGWSQRRFQVIDSEFDMPGDNEYMEDTIHLTSLTLEYDLDWGTVFSSTSWIDEDSERSRDLSGFFAPSYYPWEQTLSSEADVFAQEIRLASEFSGELQFLLGLYYEKKETFYQNTGIFGGVDPSLNVFAPGEVLLYRYEQTSDLVQSAFFGEIYYDVTENVKLTFGGRWFSYERKGSEETFATPFGVPDLALFKDNEDDISLKAGVEYTPTDNALIYLTWSEGFRLGYPVPAEPLAATCDTDNDGFYDGSNSISTGARNIDSDYVENYELGGKFSLLDNQLQVNTALYQIDWDGIPINTIFDFCNATANAGKARSQGIELEVSYYLGENILLNFSSSYVDAELTEDAPALGAQAGARLPGSPRYNASFGAEYGFSLNGHDGYFRADYAYVGGFYNNLSEAGTEIADYRKLDMKAGIFLGQFSLDVYINNVTNADNLTWIDSESWASGERGNRLRPRTIGFHVGYQF